MGDSTYMGCVFQSTEEKHMTKVDWTFSSGEHAKVMRRNHYCVVEAPGDWCQDSGVEGESRHEVPYSGIARAWSLDLVRTGPSPSLATWLGNVSFLVGKMTLTKIIKIKKIRRRRRRRRRKYLTFGIVKIHV